MHRKILLLIVFVLGACSVGMAQDLSRVGVDVNRNRPLSLRDALSLALENNKDIEVARENVRIAEFDLIRDSQPRLFTSVSRARSRASLVVARTARRSKAITPALRDSKENRRLSAGVIVSTSRR
jgi:hypothetical protein